MRFLRRPARRAALVLAAIVAACKGIHKPTAPEQRFIFRNQVFGNKEKARRWLVEQARIADAGMHRLQLLHSLEGISFRNPEEYVKRHGLSHPLIAEYHRIYNDFMKERCDPKSKHYDPHFAESKALERKLLEAERKLGHPPERPAEMDEWEQWRVANIIVEASHLPKTELAELGELLGLQRFRELQQKLPEEVREKLWKAFTDENPYSLSWNVLHGIVNEMDTEHRWHLLRTLFTPHENENRQRKIRGQLEWMLNPKYEIRVETGENYLDALYWRLRRTYRAKMFRHFVYWILYETLLESARDERVFRERLHEASRFYLPPLQPGQ